MELMEALRTRRACRQFTDEPVSQAEIEGLIAAAILAPSAMNLQPWTFVVVMGQARLQEMSKHAKEAALEYLPGDSPLRGHVEDQSFEIFHGAAALIVICATTGDSQAAEDCCLAAENLMLAARATGLGTCWIGLSRPWLGLPKVRAELGLPGGAQAVAPIIVGHPRSQPAATPRNKAEIVWVR